MTALEELAKTEATLQAERQQLNERIASVRTAMRELKGEPPPPPSPRGSSIHRGSLAEGALALLHQAGGPLSTTVIADTLHRRLTNHRERNAVYSALHRLAQRGEVVKTRIPRGWELVRREK